MIKKDKLRAIDFFCGGGGFSEGFRQAGFKVIWAIDNWQPAVDTHNENHPEGNAVCEDVIKISNLPNDEFERLVPDSEVIIGSPPCTAFSNSNKSGGGDKAKGVQLIEAYLRIVFRKKYKSGSILKYWLLENVPKVKNHIKDEYTGSDLGLNITKTLKVKGEGAGEYNAKFFGVPSSRIRYFCGEFPPPDPIIKNDASLIPLKKILSALGAPNAKLHKKIQDPIYGITLRGEKVTDHHYIQLLSEFETSKLIRLKQDKGYMGRMSVPENPEKPARTIMATMSFTSRECFVLAHTNGQLRAPTIREVASLMSFPIDYRFYGDSLGTKYRLVGNAVPPRLSFAFAKSILKQEGRRAPKEYKKIKHHHEVEFNNLNLNEIAIKQEKVKKATAKFKYHIPYFKFETYRVELVNSHSDFDNLNFVWKAEIHYNQGKERAKIYTPSMQIINIESKDIIKADKFFEKINNKIVDQNEFQRIHSMTIKEIRDNALVGPYEILTQIKEFIDKEFIFFKENKEKITLSEPPYDLPKPIVIGYYLLNKFVLLMTTKDGQTRKNK